MRADLGVMISASHNPHYDNGIKFFGPDGYKLSDQIEHDIEALLASRDFAIDPDHIGRVTRVNEAPSRYVEYVKTTVPDRIRLHGMKVVLDCANGAAYRAAPKVLWELGAEVIAMGVSPDGYNINKGCGSTSPEAAAQMIRDTGADIGICLDGDADRIIVLDETGAVVDGDQIMGLLAGRWAAAGRLNHNTLVSTVMSNLGLENYLSAQGITLKRTDVGDRYVVQAMREGGYNLGGEQSGHIVLTDHATTGDGLVAGLQVLALLKESDDLASRLTRVFQPVPQILENVRFTPGTDPLKDPAVQDAIAKGEAQLGSEGRLLIRASGTEPVIRVMGEGPDRDKLHGIIRSICETISVV
jgi:phosphoglucosamine mutase